MSKNKIKSICVLILLLVPALFFAINLETTIINAETEPNGSFAEATEITTSGETISGTYRWQPPSDLFDYYKVNCLAGTSLTVDKNSVSPDDLTGVHYVEFFSPSHSSLGTHADPALAVISCDVSGYYFIRLSSDYPGTPSYSYDVTFTAGPAPPSLAWVSPSPGEIEFGTDPDPNHALFNVTYTSANLDSVELWINGVNKGTLGSSPAQVNLVYDGSIDGSVTCTLKGYQGSVSVIERSRSFTFKKIVSSVCDFITEDIQTMGDKLYSILYDPSGDLSWSGWEETSTMSLLVGSELSMSTGVEVSAEFDFWLFSGGASFGIDVTSEVGYEFRYEITEFLEIHSVSTENGDPDFIGPGRGDVYWGETWLLHWQLYAQNKTYWNGENEYEDSIIKYGVQRSATSLLTDDDAPQEWRDQNLVHMGYPEEHIDWIDNSSDVSGGIGNAYTVSQEISTTTQQSQSVELSIDASVSLEVWGVETTISLGLNTKVYKETSELHSVKKIYSIGDDETGDHLYHKIGVDKRFGTYIFKTEVGTNTSSPHEHDTINYIRPNVASHIITYDTSGDGLGPCQDDNPWVTATITDDGFIAHALLYYSFDGGSFWGNYLMVQSLFDETEWNGIILSAVRGTQVLWYIEATDNYGIVTTYDAGSDQPFQYTVINRAPVVEITFPTGGENITAESLYITWDASDLDDDVLTFDVSYNIANTGWHLLAEDIIETFYVWDISKEDYSDSVLIKVVADDGAGGTTEEVTPYVFSIGTVKASFGSISVLILSLISLTYISIRFKKQRK